MEDFYNKKKCDRCGGPLTIRIMSRFNTDTICPDCEVKEKAHPLYEKAKAVELDAVKNGNYNFPGIGKPADL